MCAITGNVETYNPATHRVEQRAAKEFAGDPVKVESRQLDDILSNLARTNAEVSVLGSMPEHAKPAWLKVFERDPEYREKLQTATYVATDLLPAIRKAEQEGDEILIAQLLGSYDAVSRWAETSLSGQDAEYLERLRRRLDKAGVEIIPSPVNKPYLGDNSELQATGRFTDDALFPGETIIASSPVAGVRRHVIGMDPVVTPAEVTLASHTVQDPELKYNGRTFTPRRVIVDRENRTVRIFTDAPITEDSRLLGRETVPDSPDGKVYETEISIRAYDRMLQRAGWKYTEVNGRRIWTRPEPEKEVTDAIEKESQDPENKPEEVGSRPAATAETGPETSVTSETPAQPAQPAEPKEPQQKPASIELKDNDSVFIGGQETPVMFINGDGSMEILSVLPINEKSVEDNGRYYTTFTSREALENAAEHRPDGSLRVIRDGKELPAAQPERKPGGAEASASGKLEESETDNPKQTEESYNLSKEVNEFGKPFVISSDGSTDFGYIDKESGLTPLPIRLSLGENHKDEKGNNHGYGYLHIEAGHKNEILQNGFSSIEEFVEEVARNYTEIKEGAKIGQNQTYLLEIADKHNNTLFIQLSRNGEYWNVNSAGIFNKRYSRRRPEVFSRPAVGDGTAPDTTEVDSGLEKNSATAPAGNSSKTSDRKVNTNSPDNQTPTPEKTETPSAESAARLRTAADKATEEAEIAHAKADKHSRKMPSPLREGKNFSEKMEKWEAEMAELNKEAEKLEAKAKELRKRAKEATQAEKEAKEAAIIAEGGVPEDADGNWDFSKVSPEHAFTFLTAKEDFAPKDIVEAADVNITGAKPKPLKDNADEKQREKYQKALEEAGKKRQFWEEVRELALRQMDPEEVIKYAEKKHKAVKAPKKPKVTANIRQNRENKQRYEKELEQAEEEKQYWKEIKKEAAARKAEAEKAAEAARAEEIRRQEEERRQAEEAGSRSAATAVGREITDRWNGAEKTQGTQDAIITPSGRTIHGRYVLAEEGAATPSHDPENGFAKSPGFPVDKNGNTVNDRDYERDHAAQQYVYRVAAGYDGRAVQDPVIVSRDGVVLSGNNRTMSGRIAARDNTDGKYIGHLEATAAKYGFTAEQVRSMKHPRLYFEAEETLPYTAETFALFNKTEKKEMNVTERSVKLGKTISEGVFNRMAREMDAYETFAEYVRSPEAVQAIKDLHAAGIIETAELPRFYSEETGNITPEGVSLLQGALIGHVFSENPDVVRMAMQHPVVRDSILKALVMLAENSRFSPEYSLIGDISRAIEIYHKGKEAGFRTVSESVLQHSLLEEMDIPETTALVIADLLNEGKTTRLQKFLKEYNAEARLADAGQLDIFSENAEPTPASEIRRQVYETLGINPKQYERYEKLRNNGKSDEPTDPEGPTGPDDNGPEGNGGGNAPESNGPQGGKPEGGGEPPQTPARPAGGAPQPGEGTEPSDAQKRAGNYRKEHRSIDGYRISIENPKGSVRRGTDENGKPWENTMRNDYGYIRGTTGADGDHIDVFLSDSPERGDVFVIDQVKEDGTFDEHKVMYGFASEQEAREAYLANYAPGWNGLGDITRVSKGEFKKWINSSRRKGKPFAEYKNVKTLTEEVDQRKTDINSEGPETAPEKPETSEPSQGSGSRPDLEAQGRRRDLAVEAKHARAKLRWNQKVLQQKEERLQKILERDPAMVEIAEAFGDSMETMEAEARKEVRMASDEVEYARAQAEQRESELKSVRREIREGLKQLGIQEDRETDVSKARQVFDRHNSDPENAALMQRAADLAQSVGVKVVFTDRLPESTGGAYDRIGIVKLPVDFLTEDFGRRYCRHILHEVIHSVTVYSLETPERELPEGLRQGARALKEIYAELRDDPDFKGEYGTKTVLEMTAELSNPVFRAKLKAKKLWRRVVDSVKTMLGLRPGSAYDAASRALEKLLDNFDADLWREYRDQVASERRQDPAAERAPLNSAMATGSEEFRDLRERAVREKGIVMPGLADKEVKVVEVPRHPFTGTGKEALVKAEKWAKKNIVGTHTATDSNGNNFEYSISNDAVEKYVSRSATGKSSNLGVHLASLVKIPEIISESIEAEVHPDFKKQNNKRTGLNDINQESLIHRFYGAATIEGTMYRVKTTMREYRDQNHSPLAHSYEITKIELLEAPSDGVVSNSGEHVAMTSKSSISAAKLLKGVEKSYDSGKFLLEESEKAENPAEIRFRDSGQLTREYGPRWLSEQQQEDGRHSTQVANTIHSYQKFGDWVRRDSQGREVSVLDASSGLGLGTRHLNEMGITTEDVEPYPSAERPAPTFRSYADVDKQYDYIISNAVLNVLPEDWRRDVLRNMAVRLKPGGKMLINVRGAKGIISQGKEGHTRLTLDDPSEILVLRPDGSIRAYQKGFTKPELKEWVQKELGDGYEVEVANKENAGSTYDTAVLVRRKAEPAAPERNLVAVHNLTEENLADALGLGGFPMPSVAVTKAGMEHKDYGPVSLVFGRESIDPARRGNKVYSGDAWTPVFPETGYKLNGKKTNEIYGRANGAGALPLFKPTDFHPDNYERRIDRRGDRSLIELFRDSYSAKQLFLSEKGNPVTETVQTQVEKYTPGRITLLEDIVRTIGVERLISESDEKLAPEVRGLVEKHDPSALEGKKPLVVKAKINNAILEAVDYAENGNIAVKADTDATRAEIDKRVNQKEFETWLSDMFSGLVEKKGIRNERDPFTPSGSSRPWEALYDALTLDNVVRAMRRQADKGGQGFFGSSIFGAATRELRDIDDVRREAAARISSVPREEYEAEKKQIVERLSKVTLPSVAGDFSRAMDFVENVNEAVAKSHTADGIYRHLKGIYPDMTRAVAEEIAGIVADIQKMATRYLEAKPRRGVGLGEVRLAVVPEGTAPELVRQLESRGIPVRTYEPGNERQRADIISRETADRGLRFRYGENDVKAVSENIHGTAVSGFHKLSEEAKTVIKDYLSGHKSSPLRVISDEKDISDLNFSKEDMEEFKTILENEDILGFYIKGDNIIIIFADRLTSASGHETLLHENVHAVADTFSDKEHRHLKVFQESMLKNHRHKKSFSRLLKEIKDSYPEEEVEEEFLAYSIGRGVHEKDWIPSLMKCLPEGTAKFIQEKIINKIYGNPDKTFRMDSDRNGTPQNTGHTESTGTRTGGRRLAEESETRTAGSGVNSLPAHSSHRGSGAAPTPREARAATPILSLAVRDTRARLDAAGDPQERRELQEQLDQLLEEQDAYATGRAPQTPAQRAGVRRAAETTAAALGEKVVIHTTAAGITHPDAAVRARMRRAKGWYDAATGEVHINAFNHATEADVARTLLHESIGHKALRDFYGERFDSFLDEIYSSAEEPIRRQIASRMGSNGWNVREATEEYMATLAETVDRHGAENLDTAARRTWQRAKTAVKRTLNRILEKAGLTTRVNLTDRDLSYLLWRQYRSRRKAGALEAAENRVRLEALKADPESFAPEKTYGYEKTPVAGQPNRANEKLTSGSILLSAKGDSSSNANVPSEVSAKVTNNTQSAKNNIRKFINGDAKMDLSSVNNAFKSIGSLFSMRSNGGSRYTILRADNGDTIALRLSDHAANGRNFGRDNADRNVSIVIERRKFNTPESDIAFTEVTIPVETFNRRPSETVRAIVEGVDGLLRGEEFSLDPSLGTVEKKGTASDATYRFRDGDQEAAADPATAEQSRKDRIFSMMIDLCERNKDNLDYRKAARTTMTARIGDLNRAMRLQRDFDRAQLQLVADTASRMLGLSIIDTDSRYDLDRTIKAVKHSHDKDELEDTAYKLLSIAGRSQVRMVNRRLDVLTRIRDTRTGDDRIVRAGKLDPTGQETVKAFRDFRRLPEQNVQTAIIRAQADINGDNSDASILAAARVLGLRQALEHTKEDATHRDNMNAVNDAIDKLTATFSRSFTKEQLNLYRQKKRALLQQQVVEQLRHADALDRIADVLSDNFNESMQRAREFRDAEKERVNNIHHDANCDMQGRPAHADRPARSKLVNNTVTSFFLAPTMTFDQMLRMFGKHSANGEGYLYYRFMSGPQGWQACEDRRFKSKQAKERILDRKAAEILGKDKAHWADLYRLTRAEGCTLMYKSAGVEVERKVSQGNLMYIYMANKMTDGAVKLRHMNITEEDMDLVEEVLDPRLRQLADWIQDEFLPSTRDGYNEVHIRMFGAPMDYVENYFPLKITEGEIQKNVEIGEMMNDGEGDTPKILTGAIRKRVFNTRALNVLDSDPVAITLEHLEEMEDWAAFSEFRRDLGTLLSYRRFKNQVKNTTSVYGAGEKLWKRFSEVAQLTGGADQGMRSGMVGEVDKAVVNLCKLGTASRITYRVFTALKQFTSLPAFGSDTNLWNAIHSTATPRASWQWCMENLPSFEKRWVTRQAGIKRFQR